jgi:hypothetical protein
VRPADDIQLVYLDLNHWISLAKAHVGHRTGTEFRDPLEVLRRAKRSGRFVFPLSAFHVMELTANPRARQRFNVADVMEELSGFAVLMDRIVIMQLEVEAAVDAMAGLEPRALPTVPILGHGILQAFGRRGGLRVRRDIGRGESVEATDEMRSNWPGGPDAFDPWLADGELSFNRGVLRGPTDAQEEAELQALGWDPTVASKTADRRAQQEEALARMLESRPEWRRSRLRDLVAFRYIALEAITMLTNALVARGLSFEDVVGGQLDGARRFADSMPNADLWISLLTARHRNPQNKWERNDIFDADAFSVAVPYCDIVLPDTEFRHLLVAEQVPERLNTQILANLHELAELIDSG